MTQKVLKVGTSAAVTIPKKAMETLGLKIGDRVKVDVNEKTGSLSIQRTKELSSDDLRIARLTANFITRYRYDLEKLANK